jgi:hypothetical protein
VSSRLEIGPWIAALMMDSYSVAAAPTGVRVDAVRLCPLTIVMVYSSGCVCVHTPMDPGHLNHRMIALLNCCSTLGIVKSTLVAYEQLLTLFTCLEAN